ncbi:PREDICTED: ganglioside GM2 activator-like isoform X1 [Priapulus caudatus]|uniref:Ganglioside GM2 activator-like isoform X1 n=1 Tax=Priapulus caudatus TaxID=37621 RepID=A0ABM1EWF1_PRICU|nr:PREDICTED: ganglioside GM2 activator-like isoform X1 [Priapulus caudatus]
MLIPTRCSHDTGQGKSLTDTLCARITPLDCDGTTTQLDIAAQHRTPTHTDAEIQLPPNGALLCRYQESSNKPQKRMKFFAVLVTACLAVATVDAQDFSWSDCSSGTPILRIDEIEVEPQPVRIPGIIYLTFVSHASRTIYAPITVRVKLMREVTIDLYFRKFVHNITVPCVSKIGSCTFEDACTEGFTDCPLHIGENTETRKPVDLRSLPNIVALLTEGKYYGRVQASDGATGEELFCLDVTSHLTSGCSGLDCVFGG